MATSNDQPVSRARWAALRSAIWLVGLIVSGCQPTSLPARREPPEGTTHASRASLPPHVEIRHESQPVPLRESRLEAIAEVERAEIHAVRPLQGSQRFDEPRGVAESPSIEQPHTIHAPGTIRPTRHLVEEPPLEPRTWGNPQAGLNEASRCYQQAMQLARRGALFAARAQLLTSLEWAAEAQDQATGQRGHREVLRRAQRTLDEADGPSRGPHPTGLDAAGDGAHAQAVEGFVHALEGSLVGSASLHALGKLHIHWGEQGTPGIVQPLAKARVYLQAACRTSGASFGAANDLGVLEARQGNATAAQGWLSHSLTLAPHPTTWQNWSLVQQGSYVAGSPPPRVPQVQWVDPVRFAHTTQPQLDAIGGRAVPAASPTVPQTATRPQAGRWWNQ